MRVFLWWLVVLGVGLVLSPLTRLEFPLVGSCSVDFLLDLRRNLCPGEEILRSV